MAVTQKAIRPQAPSLSVPLKRRIPYWVLALMRNPVSIAGTVIVIFFILIAVLAPVLAPPADPSAPYAIPQLSYEAQPKDPGPGHPFGTTEQQYDLYYGVVWGT